MSDPRRKSPLAHRQALSAPDGAVRLRERAFLTKLILRLSPKSEAAAALELPLTANTSRERDGGTFLWLGPDEWMFMAAADGGGDIKTRLGELPGGAHYQLADVSDYYSVIEISGSKACETLMKLTPFDLHPRAFRTGDVAGTMFGKAAGWILNRSGEAAKFDIIIRWSMADYLWCLIAEAGREFGMSAQEPIGQVRGLRYKA